MMQRPRQTYELTPAQKRDMREAMLSVYYHSLGRQWEQQGAPAVLLPPEMRPLDLAEALGRLEPRSPRWRDAVWRIIRSGPSRGDPAAPIERRYPRALLDVVSRDFLTELDKLRRWYRTGAHLFAAALELLADGHDDAALELIGKLNPGKAENFNSAVNSVFGLDAHGYFEVLRPDSGDSFRAQLGKLESMLGRNMQSYVLEFADAAAFHDCVTRTSRGDAAAEITVFPVSTSIVQDTATLTTTATVTTMVSGPFADLRRAIDPQCWPRSSDVVTKVDFIGDAFDAVPLTGRRDEGTPYEHQLIREYAELSWGLESDQQGAFDVVLNTGFTVPDGPAGPSVDLSFSLCRSISSTILWDRRPGGLLIDDGFIRVQPLSVPNRWRLTSRKILKFSDRTPNLNRAGWSDAGQLLNYFAPAALSWWIESETYSMESDAYRNQQLVATTGGQTA